MNKELKYDICSIRDPTLSNEDAVDFACINTNISAQLQYACTHWLTHLSQALSEEDILGDELLTFCQSHLSHWLEVLSLIQKLEFGLNGLPVARVWCKVSVSCSLY
jgi:hypothetical protein